MNNTYTCTHKTVVEALDHIDNFETIINKFKETHPEYNYKVKLEKQNEIYNVAITITNDSKEQNSILSKTKLRSYEVL